MDIPIVEESATSLLYVEDDNFTQELVVGILRRKFPRITLVIAHNGQEGLDAYAKNRPEIIVTDVRMPIIDGIAMATKIKEQDKDAPIIVLSAADETNDLLRAIDIGINYYVLKPIQVGKLINAIELCLEKINLRRQLKQKEEYILRIAYYDHLTGLPNRQLFSEFLRKSLAHAQRHELLLAVLFIDLDGFKKINDTLGHTVGDQLLSAVAERLKKSCCRDQDTVARWGGDEFIILLPDLDGAREAACVAQKIDTAFLQPMVLPDRDLVISLSTGISLFPENGLDEETLIRNADAAMYRAKSKVQNRFYHSSDSDEP
jgi:diguanylate cyclase (GGDEF)-like protein